MKTMITRTVYAVVLGGLGLVATAHAGGKVEANYPSQSIRLVVPFTPGGGNDVFARTISPEMAKILGQQIVVENKAGASGNIGAGAVARSMPADGYTILLSEVSIHSVNAHLQKNLPYDAATDLTPVVKAGTYDYVLVVSAKHSDVKTLDDLIALAKKHPDGLHYGVPGIGTPHHLGTELLLSKTGIKANAVAYRGAAPAVQDVLAGQLDFMLSDRAAVRAHVKAGTLHAVGVAGAKRVKDFPDVPTLAESGVKGFAMESWFGFSVRQGVPDVYVQKIAQAYKQAITKPEIVEKLANAGVNVTYMAPTEFRHFVEGETERWGELIRERGIKVE